MCHLLSNICSSYAQYSFVHTEKSSDVMLKFHHTDLRASIEVRETCASYLKLLLVSAAMIDRSHQLCNARRGSPGSYELSVQDSVQQAANHSCALGVRGQHRATSGRHSAVSGSLDETRPLFHSHSR